SLKVLISSIDLGLLGRAQEVLAHRALRFPNHIELILAIDMLDDCPVRVVRPHGGVNLELRRQLQKELDIFTAIEKFSELSLGLRVVNNEVVVGFLLVFDLIEII